MVGCVVPSVPFVTAQVEHTKHMGVILRHSKDGRGASSMSPHAGASLRVGLTLMLREPQHDRPFFYITRKDKAIHQTVIARNEAISNYVCRKLIYRGLLRHFIPRNDVGAIIYKMLFTLQTLFGSHSSL